MTKRNQTVVHYAENDDTDDETAFISIKRKRKKAKKKTKRSISSDVHHDVNVANDYPSEVKHASITQDDVSSTLRPSADIEQKRERSRRLSQIDDVPRKRRRCTISHSRSLKSLGLDEDGSSLEDDDDIGALATSQRRRSASRESFPNMLLRRSSRKKKTRYSTLNLSTMEEDTMSNEGYEEAEVIRREVSRTRQAGPQVILKKPKPPNIKPELRDLLVAQGKSPEEVEKPQLSDIYTSIKSRHRQRKKFFDDDDDVSVEVEVEATGNSERSEASKKKEDGDRKDSDKENEVAVDCSVGKDAGNKNSDDIDNDEDNDGDDDDDADGDEEEEEESDDDNDDSESDSDDDDHVEQVTRKKYQLRKKIAKPRRLVYEIRRQSRRTRSTVLDRIPTSRLHRCRRRSTKASFSQNTTTPYQQRQRRTYSQGASSTSSSSAEDVNDDEQKFEKRKEKSMMKARNRCLPMNLNLNDLNTHGFANERRKIGSSLADIDPMNIDKSVKFESIGGHRKHIRALKEMVVFPLMYPEVFQKFNINPPRGCLFYGPPGTGKTLMARALANECSTDGRKVAFFMRKGADCLSKWVGESERQLRLLFDQAYQMRPSIIFFDEIDGLAPVRSSRQDQIHSSIVSTLLGLMDGLDNRGEIIVIGATNRIDSIDPALRRPGRFDREFSFSLPDKKARKDIVSIHTRKWKPPLSEKCLEDLAEKTSGYCGADLMSLCAESALIALRRRYPQIYSSNEKLKLNVDNINIHTGDFHKAIKNIVPTAQRSASNPARALSASLDPLLFTTLQTAILQLAKLFPLIRKRSKLLQQSTDQQSPSNHMIGPSESESEYDDVDLTQSRYKLPLNGITQPLASSNFAFRETRINRPRLLVCGRKGDGHTSHLAPAILYDLEGLPVHVLDIPVLFGTSSRTPEEACTQVFREALRSAPSIVYMPDAPLWWETATPTIHHTFRSMLRNLPPHASVLLIATADCPYPDLPIGLLRIFRRHKAKILTMTSPSDIERLNFFSPLFYQLVTMPPINAETKNPHAHEVLEKVSAPESTNLTEKELIKIESQEESTMRNLRLFLRDVLTRLAQDRRFKVFLKPVDTEEVPDYCEVIEQPMDVSTMMKKIDQHLYCNVASFVGDINLICSNALEYNPEHRDEDRAIRHRACLLKDMAHAIIEEELDPKFELLCNEVIEARRKRNADPLKFAPVYFKAPANQRSGSHVTDSKDKTNSSSKKRRISSTGSCDPNPEKKQTRIVDDDSEEDNEANDENEAGDNCEQEAMSHDDDNDPSQCEDDKNRSGTSDAAQDDGQDDNDDSKQSSVGSEDHEEIESDTSNPEPHPSKEHLSSTPKPSSPSSSSSSSSSSLSSATSDDSEIKVQAKTTTSEDDRSQIEVSGSIPTHAADVTVKSENLASDVIMKTSDESTVPFEGDVDLKRSSDEIKTSAPSPPPLVIDEIELKNLFYYTAKVTTQMRVEDLESLHSTLVRCVYRHQDSYDKSNLLQELREEVDIFIKLHDDGIDDDV